MANQARYTIAVPHHEQDLAGAAHHLLVYGNGPRIDQSYIHRNLDGHQPQDHVVSIAVDTPEMDSHMKQMAHHIAEAGNLPVVHVTKESAGKIQSWPIRYQAYGR